MPFENSISIIIPTQNNMILLLTTVSTAIFQLILIKNTGNTTYRGLRNYCTKFTLSLIWKRQAVD